MILYPLKAFRLHKNGRLPTKATEGSAGWDLYAAHSEILRHGFGPGVIRTGIGMEIPEDWVGLVRGRSGLAFNQSVFAFEGTIDSDYRGEICVLLVNLGLRDVTIHEGDRIAQLVVVPAPNRPLFETSALGSSGRGANGFGSSGR